MAGELDDTPRDMLIHLVGDAVRIATSVVRTPGGQPGRPLLSFAWPTPAAARIDERIDKGERRVRARYRIDLNEPDAEGRRRLVLSEFELVDIEPMTAEERAQFEASRPEVGAPIPHLDVAPDGSFVRFDRPDVEEYYGKDPAEDQLDVLARNAAMFWGAWVGTWIHLDPVEMDGSERAVQFILPGSVALPGTATVACERAAEPDAPWRLRLDARLGGAAAREPIAAAVRRIASASLPETDEWGYDVRLTLEAVTDPWSLLPRSASIEHHVGIEDPARDTPGDTRARHDYEFTWLPA